MTTQQDLFLNNQSEELLEMLVRDIPEIEPCKVKQMCLIAKENTLTGSIARSRVDQLLHQLVHRIAQRN